MKIFEITLRSAENVKDFVTLAGKQPFELLVGDERHFVNGKSFMQLFCLDLSAKLQVKMDCTDEEFQSFSDAAAQFQY